MQYKFSTSALLALGLASTVFGAYVPSEPWSTLTPSSAAPSGAKTDFSSTFAIAISPITSSVSGVPSSAIHSSSAAAAGGALRKRDVVSQIGDGQIQATTGTATSTKEAKKTAEPVSQIDDGQIQATTGTATTTKEAKKTAELVSQIGDGQIQATTNTETPKKTAELVSQIGDGQIQATTNTAKTTDAVSQISDGQIQATTGTSTKGAASQINDGQVQATGTSDSTTDPEDSEYVAQVACSSPDALSMTLNGSVLTDSKSRIGSIVANHQFQFDPQPQAGLIYAAGWSVTEDGNLAIGDNDVFYQCLSGTFYNLYDESIGDQCTAVHLEVVGLVSC